MILDYINHSRITFDESADVVFMPIENYSNHSYITDTDKCSLYIYIRSLSFAIVICPGYVCAGCRFTEWIFVAFKVNQALLATGGWYQFYGYLFRIYAKPTWSEYGRSNIICSG